VKLTRSNQTGQKFLFEGSIWRFLSAKQLTNVARCVRCNPLYCLLFCDSSKSPMPAPLLPPFDSVNFDKRRNHFF
jgi:hypothetical protein